MHAQAASATQAAPDAPVRFAGPDPRQSPYATVRAVLAPRLADGRNVFGRWYP